MTEAEKAMLASKKRQDEEQQKLLQEYDENRRLEREKEEEELRKLKEKQEKRKLEREQEERAEAERRKQEEERRKKEDEERRARQEEEKRKREEEKLKKQQKKAQMFPALAMGSGRNFIIPKKSSKDDKFGNIVQAKQEMGMTKEQQEEARRNFISGVEKSIPASSEVSADDLKAKIKELHQRICKLEADKYDMERRHERQEYDVSFKLEVVHTRYKLSN
ncbi:unnamed protein product [Strongylus vulgaris]|uniref:Troponin T n=1 Tax=Strongylus vulgaris TaxID=40348 RepID=A0A3P7L2Y0_STRVU|nr:unnamed protein product [Strongylus vulgaris]